MRLAAVSELGVFEAEHIVLFGAPADLDLRPFGTARLSVIQDMMPDANDWTQRGVDVVEAVDADLAVVFLPRSKVEARDRIAQAARGAARIVIDGQKTDGIESILRDVKKLQGIDGVLSKAHGKSIWLTPTDALQVWRVDPMKIDGIWHVEPGVFSADGVDPGSELLAAALPELSGVVADLGAGWGYLGARILQNSSPLKALHLVEAQGAALRAARRNIRDERVQFHWADATEWQLGTPLDAVVMNPPFHAGRSANPEIGRNFIHNAAKQLRKGGVLWMVANRHLPYEPCLQENFASVEEIGGDGRYKLFRAASPTTSRATTQKHVGSP